MVQSEQHMIYRLTAGGGAGGGGGREAQANMEETFSAPPFSVHVAYKKYKIKRKFTFFR